MERIKTEVFVWGEALLALLPGAFGNWIRSLYYGIFLGSVGRKFKIGAWSRIQQPNAIIIGNRVSLNDRAWVAANINGGKIYIGDDTIIGPNCVIHSGNHIFLDKSIPVWRQGFKFKEIKIGRDVWIGANVTILQGVIIDDGAVIAAGSVVTTNVDPYSVFAGVPAKKIKER